MSQSKRAYEARGSGGKGGGGGAGKKPSSFTLTANITLMGLPEARAALTLFPETLVRGWVMKGVKKAARKAAKRYREMLKRHRRTGLLGKSAGFVARVYRHGKVLFCVVGARRGLWGEIPGLGTVRPTKYQHLLERGRKAVRAGTGKKQSKALALIVGTGKSFRGGTGGKSLAFVAGKPIKSLRRFTSDDRINGAKGTAITKKVTKRDKPAAFERGGKSSASFKGWRVFSTRAAAAPAYGLLAAGVNSFRDDLLSLVPAAIKEGCELAGNVNVGRAEPNTVSGGP